MTEIQWLVDVLLNSKLPGPVKDRFIARIGEVEAGLGKIVPRGTPIQQPSTQRLLSDDQVTASVPVENRIVGGEIVKQSGNGTSLKGPRKW